MKKSYLKEFLSQHLKKNSKLLLGLSGGADSMALFSFLIEYMPILKFSLHVAHVDHRWREESRKEAQFLHDHAQQLKVPFHLKVLDIKKENNLEDRCRIARIEFFKQLHAKHCYQALLLAHHSGDQAETVVKRVFEGAGLKALGGLRKIKYLGNLPVWRPLLPFSKRELMIYLENRGLAYFNDSSNSDTRFLRARMREKMFPQVENLFGKNIQKNCVKLGNLCQELSDYFDQKSKIIKKRLVSGPFGDYLPLDIHLVELKYFLKQYVDEVNLSSDALDLLIELIKEKRIGKVVQASPFTFHISRSHLFILKKKFPCFLLEQKKWKKVEWGDWKRFWKGEVAFPVKTECESILNLNSCLRKKVKKWYAYHKVPSFFYNKAPIFIRKGKVIGECLTGYSINTLS